LPSSSTSNPRKLGESSHARSCEARLTPFPRFRAPEIRCAKSAQRSW